MSFMGNYARNLGALALGREPCRPLLFSYYITHRCEFNCSYCSDGTGDPFKQIRVPELTTPEAKELVSVLRRDCDTLDVTGGEPMERTDLEDVLQHARQMNFRIVLNTKGVGLRERAAVIGLCDVVVLSLDALDITSLSRLTGKSAAVAEQMVETVRFAMEAGRRMGTKVALAAVVTPENIPGAAEVLRFAVQNNIAFQLSPQIEGTRPHRDLRGNPAYRELIELVLRTKAVNAKILGIPGYLRGIRDFSSFRCHPLLMPAIRPDGHLYYPCLESGQAEVSVLKAGSYRAALRQSIERFGKVPDCGEGCQIFCHMALSLLQRHPLAAVNEWKTWRN